MGENLFKIVKKQKLQNESHSPTPSSICPVPTLQLEATF